jgi:hypothetical protein
LGRKTTSTTTTTTKKKKKQQKQQQQQKQQLYKHTISFLLLINENSLLKLNCHVFSLAFPFINFSTLSLAPINQITHFLSKYLFFWFLIVYFDPPPQIVI